MTEAGPSSVPLRAVIHRRHHINPPSHHVVAPANTTGQTILENLPLLPSFLPPRQPEQLYSSEQTSVFLHAGPESSRTDLDDKQNSEIQSPTTPTSRENLVRIGFQNPWDSWHKPTLSEVWNGLHWTQQGEEPKHKGHNEFEAYRTAIEEARRKESGQASEQDDETKSTLNASQEHLLPSKDMKDLKGSDLAIHKPDFSQSSEDANSVKATWLGHATVLLQLPSSKADPASEPIKILFDPIFSHRCSPTQYVGPSRLYSAPCTVADLPKIDVVCISHSHYDHLDYDSIFQLWNANADHIRFIVPLGNKSWFLGLGLKIDEDRVSELDWWDEVWLTQDGLKEGKKDEGRNIRIICTPAQHGSGRYGFDASRSLWSSWTIEYTHTSKQKPFRVFFGGDTGFQFHSSSPQATHYPTCPAFSEVQKELGIPHLSFLPISVGATFNFVKSYDALGVVPEMDGGLTGANHMTPFDAVRVAKILTCQPGEQDRQPDYISDQQSESDIHQPVVMAIHWGTFVSGMDEVRRSMHDLESACAVQDVLYARQYDQRKNKTKTDTKGLVTFACIDHGQSIWMNLQ
jgi:N-acyl-phosphatidylethanolamine-hydrolysing phospholipase D